MISDDVVIAELLKDAKKFKSKWYLNVSEPSRTKPNTKFLQRTLSNIVKMNANLTTSKQATVHGQATTTTGRSTKQSGSKDIKQNIDQAMAEVIDRTKPERHSQSRKRSRSRSSVKSKSESIDGPEQSSIKQRSKRLKSTIKRDERSKRRSEKHRLKSDDSA